MILDGRKIKNETLDELRYEVSEFSEKPSFVVIQVGNDEASNVYIKQKEKMAVELGYKFVHKKFDEQISQEELIREINNLNNDSSIDGILVQMPIPEHLDSIAIQNSVNPNKDVDGLTYINSGRTVANAKGLVPCTPKGIVALLDHYNITLEGANVVVIGRSLLVGKPIANLLINRNATVTVCHSKTKNLSDYTKMADIVIVAVGKDHFLKEDMVKDGAVIIDVGINRVNDKLYGDVDFDNVSKKASYITPVPGGVGPMTIAMLATNVYEAHNMK
jgi:methylenetetrahydrofolate dehydrogenase (NADP+)/methenyltetrahydrofolate cyclohydrolase